MKFLCLAYGSADDWEAMSKQEQAEVLEQDERIRNRGDFMAAVQTAIGIGRSREASPYPD